MAAISGGPHNHRGQETSAFPFYRGVNRSLNRWRCLSENPGVAGARAGEDLSLLAPTVVIMFPEMAGGQICRALNNIKTKCLSGNRKPLTVFEQRNDLETKV